MERCKDCPLNKSSSFDGIECAAHSIPHKQFCNLVGKNEKYHVKIVEKSIEVHDKNAEKLGLPPIQDQVKNFAKGMLKWAKDGFKVAPKEVQEERFSICLSCEHYNEGRCNKCGCFLKGAKVSIASQSCPEGKWGAWNDNKGGCGCKK